MERFTQVKLPILILLALINTLCDAVPSATLQKCEGFIDHRNVTSDDIYITVPGNLTNSNQTLDFAIGEKTSPLPCKNSFYKTVSWEDGEYLKPFKSTNRGLRLRNSGKLSSHFTQDGYYHEEGNFYRTKDYCVMSISDSHIELNICSVSCTDSGKICVPKCCGVDEILVYWNFTCKKVSSLEPRWDPKFHNTKYPHRDITDKKELDRIHVQRQQLSCNYFDYWPLSDTPRANPARGDGHFETPWRLVPNGRPLYLSYDREWHPLPDGDYCADGYANWGNDGRNGNGTYSGNGDKHSVLLICFENNTTYLSADEPKIEREKIRATIYSTVLLLASVFPLLTIIVHVLLLDTQHLHGLTVLCHAISMFCFYVFLAIAHLFYLFPSWKGEPRTGFCIAVAILAHYFCMSIFFWLSVMNFDLWLTFRSMRPVSRMSKRIRRFSLYFGIGYGLPAIMSATFYALDEIYRDKKTEVKVPEYGDKNCFVATYARPYYLYSLIAIALAFNTIVIIWTFFIFYGFRKQNAQTFTTRRTQSDKYSVRLFIKLFCVMGTAWFVELLSWKYNGDEKPWFVFALDCVMFLQAVAIFWIFCVNRRTLKLLEEKYTCLRPILGPLRTLTWFRAPSDAEGCVEMTTPGSTSRKLSLSVTTNTKASSLPRKASNSSIRSLSSTKWNGKMESIPLDSDSESGVGTLESLNDIVEQAPTPPDLLADP